MATVTKQPSKQAAKQSATVRISEQSHVRLRELAAQSGEPMQAVLDKALEQYRRQKFWEECNAAYTALQQDAEAWKEYQEELKVWEVTLMDGLDPNEVWTDADFSSPPEEKVA
ncbi:MAG: hypothetical protein ACRYFS_23605 [Janthinobacterium lividum]